MCWSCARDQRRVMCGWLYRCWSRRLWLVPLAVLALLVGCSTCLGDEIVQVCGSYSNNVFAGSSAPGIAATGLCPTTSYNGGGFGLFSTGTASQGQAARWQATAPSGLELTGAVANQIVSAGVNDGGDYGGGFYYAGGGPETNDQTPSGLWMIFPTPSSYFGMQLVCGKPTCNAPAQLDLGTVSLYARETIGPTFAAPSGLWQAPGWARGTWPFFGWANSPSGVCSLSASLNGQLIDTTTSAQDVSSWHQCLAPPVNQPVDTSRYGQGALALTLSASDAAGAPASTTKTIHVDNSTPTMTLSGPVDAPSTAGTQYVTASAGGSPSGIADIVCSVDQGPGQTYSGPTAQVPVSGIGTHTVSCYAQNNAVDPSGVHGRSSTATWSLKIGQPTVVGIAFDKLAGLRCHAARVGVKVPGHWITVHRHGKRVKVRTRAHTHVERVMRCHPRTVRRRTVVFIPHRRHGHSVKVKRIKVVRVVVPPRVIARTSRAVAFGRGTTVNGYLGTSAGIAIGDHAVSVLTAPDNGGGQFSPAAVVTTAANGTWTATLPPGPSRIVEAVYSGDPTTQGASSGEVRVIVRAKVKLLSVTRRVAWGGTVRITGQLFGGYIPPGGALVRLRIGQGSSYQTYGVQEHVTGNGRFTTAYTFGAGYAGIYKSYWFQIATLPMGDYPYAPAASGRRSVLVGGHPRPLATPRRHHKHTRRRAKHRRTR
jgi:hypothetical protein